MYKTLFQHALFPIYEAGIRRRNTLKYRRFLQKNQWQSADQLEAAQWIELKNLLDHAYNNSPYYRQVFRDLNILPEDIRSYEDFQQLPVCSREDMVANHESMISENFSNEVMRKSTGGSTGVPVRFALDRNSYEWRIAISQRGYSWAGCEAGQHTVYLWGVDVGNPGKFHQIKNSLYHSFYNRKMFNCFDFTEAEMQRCLDYINRRKPTGMVGFTTAVYNFAQFIEKNNLSCHPIRSVITGAEKLYDHQRETIERALHTKVFNTYGCREFMLIAAECDHHEGLHLSVDNLFVEVLADGKPVQPGQRGELVITDLHNFGMPFIRYKNGDLVIQSDHKCSCGRGLPLIEDIDGRRMDEIVATNGKVLSGGFFPHLMKEFDEIVKFQVIQKAINKLDIKLITRKDLTADRLEFCFQEIRKVAGDDMQIETVFVDDIPLSSSGKFRVTISEIASR